MALNDLKVLPHNIRVQRVCVKGIESFGLEQVSVVGITLNVF